MEEKLNQKRVSYTSTPEKFWVLNEEKEWVLCQLTVNDMKKMCYILNSIDSNAPIIIPYSEEKHRIKNYKKYDGKNISDIITVNGIMEEEAIEIILERFIKNNSFYTHCGKTLIALNTWKDVGLFDEKIMNYYLTKRKGPPHIYDLLMNLLDQIKLFNINRKVIFKGYYNSGRSINFLESLKFVIARPKLLDSNQNIRNKILNAYQILTSFTSTRDKQGNINYRTSTWFMTIFEHDVITHFRLLPFLFKSSYLNSTNPQETNFQIFYQICCKYSQQLFPNIKIACENEYILLSNERLSFNTNKDICENFQKTIEALEKLDFSFEEIEALARIIVAILSINNYNSENIKTEPSVYINNDPAIAEASIILGLDKELAKIIFPDDIPFISTNELKCSIIIKENVKLLGQHLYMCLLRWMCIKINASSKVSDDHNYLLLIDLEGFYNQAYNGLDNLYINICNEKIESITSTNTLKDIAQLNLNEGTDFDFIYAQQNRYNIASMMKFIFKYNGEDKHEKNENDLKNCMTGTFEKSDTKKFYKYTSLPTTSFYDGNIFTIKHFCQDVSYYKDDFVNKRENTTITNFKLLENSKNEIIKGIVNLPPTQIEKNERSLYDCNCLFTPFEYLFNENVCNFSNRNHMIQIFIQMMNNDVLSDYFTVLCLSSEKELMSDIDHDYIRKQIKHYNLKSGLKLYNSFIIKVPMKILFNVYYKNFLSDTITISDTGKVGIDLVISQILKNDQNFKKTKNYMMMTLTGFKELEMVRELALKPYKNLIKIFISCYNSMIQLKKYIKEARFKLFKDSVNEIILIQYYVRTYFYVKRYRMESKIFVVKPSIYFSKDDNGNITIEEKLKNAYLSNFSLLKSMENSCKQSDRRKIASKIFEMKPVVLFKLHSQNFEVVDTYKESLSYLKDICNFLMINKIELNNDIYMNIFSYIKKLKNRNLFNIFELLMQLKKHKNKIHEPIKNKYSDEIEDEKTNSLQYKEFLSIYRDLEIISISSKLPILYTKICDKLVEKLVDKFEGKIDDRLNDQIDDAVDNNIAHTIDMKNTKAKIPIKDAKINTESNRILNNSFIDQINIMKCLEVLFSEQFLDLCFSEKNLFNTLIYLIVSTCIKENNTQHLNQFYFGFECNLEKFIFQKWKSYLYLSYMLEEILKIINNLKQLIQELNIRSTMLLKYNSLLFFINKMDTYIPLIVNKLMTVIKIYLNNLQEDFLETPISNVLSQVDMDLIELKNPETDVKGFARFIFKMNKLLKVFKCGQLRRQTQNILINEIFKYCNKMILNSFLTCEKLCSLYYAQKLEENINVLINWYLKFVESDQFDTKMEAFYECSELILILHTSNDLLDDLKNKIKKLNHLQVFQILTNSNMNISVDFPENIKLKIEEICDHFYSQKTNFSQSWNLLSSDEFNQNLFENYKTFVSEFKITESTLDTITECGIKIQKTYK